jgi:hypothetical protein
MTDDSQTTRLGPKYTASRADIIDDFLDNVERLRFKYAYHRLRQSKNWQEDHALRRRCERCKQEEAAAE